MKKILSLSCIIVSYLFLTIHVSAQPSNFKQVTANAKVELEQKILEEFTKVKTLRCNFKEEKKMSFLDEVQKSTGIMLFKAKNLLRWEYKVPNNYIFVLNNQKVYLKNDKGTSHFNTSSNKVMKTMSQLIIGTINGESLRNNADFKIDYYTSSKEYLIILTPTDKNIKKFLSSIELYLDNSTFLATQMIMNEQSGDVTKYSFSNVEKNEEIANSLFVLD